MFLLGEVIKGGHGTAQDRLDKIKEAVDELAKVCLSNIVYMVYPCFIGKLTPFT